MLIGKITSVYPILIVGFASLALLYTILTLIALGTTQYHLDETGINVRFGIWQKFLPWQTIEGFYQENSFFATKVKVPGTTPCVRLSNALVLVTKDRKMIFLTPKDFSKMADRIRRFVPELKISKKSIF